VSVRQIDHIEATTVGVACTRVQARHLIDALERAIIATPRGADIVVRLDTLSTRHHAETTS
jgi:hypothetical protein